MRFLAGEPVDRPPFHPIFMRWAARYAGVPYREFCLEPARKCEANLRCAEDFDLDWVTVLSDPYCEAEAFGLSVTYPDDNLPLAHEPLLHSAADGAALRPYTLEGRARLNSRLAELRRFREDAGDRFFIVGWVEGPIAEYSDLRGLTETALDLVDEPDRVARALDAITEAALDFITAQLDAGAHCVGIGDAFCSQIGPRLYRAFAFERERAMVERIHACGGIAKLHICGNTHAILPDMIATGADIIDVDHLVPSMEPFAHLLGPGQVFCGKADPVAVIQDGTEADITAAVAECAQQAGGRCIVSAGCEIPPDTSAANVAAFRASIEQLTRRPETPQSR
jgi:MtaA/CmuA family methyltransferase